MTSSTLADAIRKCEETCRRPGSPRSLSDAFERAISKASHSRPSTLGEFVEAELARTADTAELRIARLYDHLARLESAPVSQETEAEVRRTLCAVRQLERAESERMRAYFERHRSFDPDAAERAIEDARKLIHRHERPA